MGIELAKNSLEPALDVVKEGIQEALGTVLDPCSCMASTPVSIVDLGIVSEVSITDEIVVKLSLTDPMCLYFIDMGREIESAIRKTGWSGPVRVEYDTEGAWHSGLMSESARQRLAAIRGNRVNLLGIRPYKYDASSS